MPEYAYKVQNLSGKIVKGNMEADSEGALMEVLKARGLYPIEIRETSALTRDIDLSIFQRVTLRDIAIFCRQFSTVISAGITVLSGLDIMRQQTENKKLKNIINKLFEEVQKGRSLSSTMREHKEFPLLFINMIEAGEASGQLELMLDRMAAYYEKEYKLRGKIKGALSYPMVVSIVAIAVVIFLVTKIVPIFAGMFESSGAELPLPTRMLLAASHIIGSYWYIILFVIGLLMYLLKRYIESGEGRYRYHRFLLHCPVISKVNKKIVTSRFSSTLSILLSSGIPVIQALDVVQKTITNAVVEKGIERCKDDVKRGTGLSKPIGSIGVFPPMLIEMISIGEESGQIDTMLAKTSDFYDSEVDSAVNSITSLIEPIIIVILGGMVAFIVLSIVLPMFNMYSLVQ